LKSGISRVANFENGYRTQWVQIKKSTLGMLFLTKNNNLIED
jgi:hypothetical protein